MTREEALEIVKASFQWRGLYEDISPSTGMLAISGDKEIYQAQRDTILRAHRIINNDINSPTVAQGEEDRLKPGAVTYVIDAKFVNDPEPGAA